MNYSCFWPFVGQSRIIIKLWYHVTRITQIIIWLITQKWPNIIQYSAEWYSIFTLIFASRSNTSPPNHLFLLRLLFNLSYRGLRITSMTNLDAGLCFAKICCFASPEIIGVKVYHRQTYRKTNSLTFRGMWIFSFS